MAEMLLIRADASPRMGTGHVMRCLALAQAWQKHGPVVFACAELTPALGVRLAAESCQARRLNARPGSPEDAAETLDLARQLGASWVVLDGYQFDSAFQRALKQGGLRLLAFDDYGHVPDPCADLMLNQNLGATAGLYPGRSAGTRLLLGTRHALLRKEFLAWRGWQRAIPTVARKVLVTLGGADPDNVTARVVEALQGLDVEARVVVGGSNPHLEQLKSEIGNRKSEMELIADAPNMPELMAWADVAVAAGGSTSWELAFMGLPSLVFTLAENQVALAAALVSSGVAANALPAGSTVGDMRSQLALLLQHHARRAEMSALGHRLVDGMGAGRVVSALASVALSLRPVEPGDCRTLWEWANDPLVRAVSFNPAPIPWEVHQQWFEARLRDPACVFLVAENSSGTPVGQVRFETKDGEAVVSVSLDPQFRGRGYGAALLRQATERLHQEHGIRLTHAYAKRENTASVRALEQAGYTKLRDTRIDSHAAVELVFQTHLD